MAIVWRQAIDLPGFGEFGTDTERARILVLLFGSLQDNPGFRHCMKHGLA